MMARLQSGPAMTAIAVFLGGLVLIGFLAALPFIRLSAIEQTMSDNRSELLQLRKEIAREGELRKENAALAVSDKDARLLLLEGKTTGIAGANLQKILSGLVVGHGGEATSFQILPPQEDGNLMRIPLSLSIRVGIDGLRDIVHGLETSTPLIFIDDIAISAGQEDFRAPDPHYLGPLDVTLQVSGFVYQNEFQERVIVAMPKNRAFLLTLVCAALGVLVFLDHWSADDTIVAPAAPGRHQSSQAAKATAETTVAAAPAVAPAVVAKRLANPLADFDKSRLKAWRERPLFAPSWKRPPKVAKAPTGPVLQVRSVQPPSTYDLLGIVRNGSRAIALLRKKGRARASASRSAT